MTPLRNVASWPPQRKGALRIVIALAAAVATALAFHRFSDSVCFSHRAPQWDDPAAANTVVERTGPLQLGELDREYKAKGIPAVFRGLAAAEVASGFWKPRRLARDHGDHTVTMHTGNVEHYRTKLFKMKLREFLKMIHDEQWVRDFTDDGAPRGTRMPRRSQTHVRACRETGAAIRGRARGAAGR